MRKSCKKIFFLRHGETNANRLNLIQGNTPDKLNEKGIRQIEDISIFFAEKNIDLIVSSDILRARQSSKILSRILEVPTIYTRLAREKDNGVFTGLPSRKNFWKEIKGKYHLKKAPEGESLTDVFLRAKNFLKYLKKLNQKTILVVSHGTLLKIIKGISKKLSVEESIEKIKIKNGGSFLLEI